MFKKLLIINLIYINIFSFGVFADVINEIKVKGNSRIPDSSIIMFSGIKLNHDMTDYQLNEVIKNLYNTNFFENISIKIENNLLQITVKEFPLIENINIDGIKAKKYLQAIEKNYQLKPRSAFNKILLPDEIKRIKTILKDFGFFFAEVTPYIEKLENNNVELTYKIELGKRAKITKISFIGSKVFKDKKLRDVIVSEESKFWKFISNKKFLNEELIEFDKRLLKNFFLNKGYYNIVVNSSFAKLIDDDEFELI